MKKLLLLLTGISLALSSGAQLQNPDFELWESPITESSFSNKPVGWTWTNSAQLNSGTNFYYPPSQDAHSNNYALYLSVWYNYTKDAALQHVPVNSRPSALRGFYKYRHNFVLGNAGMQRDTAMISVYLTKYNNSTHLSDTIGRGILEIGDSTGVYTEFTVNINYINAQTPDSLIVILDPSLVRRYADRDYQIQGDSLAGHTSFFTIDGLSLINGGTTGLEETHVTQEIKVYPNPAVEYIYLDNVKGDITIWDVSGKIVSKLSGVSTGKIDVANLQPGIFMLQVKDGRQIYDSKFLKL